MTDIISRLQNWVSSLFPKSEPLIDVPIIIPSPPVVAPPLISLPPWMEVAKSLINTKETPGTADNPEILHWAKEIGVGKDYTHDSIAWCGLFIGFCLRHSGLSIVGTPLWARAWAVYGRFLAAPAFGAIMVFVREGGGHVGFYVSEDESYYHILGGNQSDAVNITRVAKDRCIAYRWPPNADQYFKSGRIVKRFDGQVSYNEA